jgi:hypothetical protein
MLMQMTSSQFWGELPVELAEVLDDQLAAVADEIIAAIGREVPGYARPLEGAFGRGLRAGVTEALGRFLGSIRDPGSAGSSARRAYVALGRQEYTAGRTLDALQAAYRVGARVAWRRFARAGNAAGFPQQTIADLAEAIFAYIDELSSESVEGYAQAQADHAGERQRARTALVESLLAETAVSSDRTALVAAASWSPPPSVAALACPIEALPGIARRLGAEVLHAEHGGLGCALVPDAEGPGRREAIGLAVRATRAAIGPAGGVEELPSSWLLASGALSVSGLDGLLVADEHLAELVLHESVAVVERIAERRLHALAVLTPAARDRMERTALAFVQMQGNAAAMARALHVHPQTARYRIARLRELLGAQLDDPGARFELEAALRHRLKAPSRAFV